MLTPHLHPPTLPPQQGLVFFLGREVPREHLLLVIRAFGGEAGWEGEGSPLAEADERITHQVRAGWAGGTSGWRCSGAAAMGKHVPRLEPPL